MKTPDELRALILKKGAGARVRFAYPGGDIRYGVIIHREVFGPYRDRPGVLYWNTVDQIQFADGAVQLRPGYYRSFPQGTPDKNGRLFFLLWGSQTTICAPAEQWQEMIPQLTRRTEQP